MSFFNFYKNITFFFLLYFICQILSADFCVAQNTGMRTVLDVGSKNENGMITATNNHTIKSHILFAFGQKIFLYKRTKNSIKSKEEPSWIMYCCDYASLMSIRALPVFFIPIFFTWTGTSVIWLIVFFVAVFAAIAGYLYGKKRGKRIALANEYPAQVRAPVVLNEKSNYEDLAEQEKPFIQKYDMVTVLFADIKGFTEITDSMDPETLLDELNSFFFYFDTIVDRYHIEKIKTMGDAYMCAGGIPQKNHTNPIDVVLVALDVQNHLSQMSKQNPDVWSVRVGIHTGQVIAGMLGHKKLSFDIWGHTVNVASRLESSCEAGKINISGETYEKIKQYFDCEYQGLLSSTNDVSYYVKGLKPEYIEECIDGQLVTNHAFAVQMQLLRLNELEEYVESMMADVTSNMFFHNYKHSIDVFEQVGLLAHAENIGDEDKLLLKTAALMHDIGFAISYDDVRVLSEDITRESLPLFQYHPKQIDMVCRLMNASHYESVPNGILEEIIHDAHQMYLGRADYITKTMGLYREQTEHNIPEPKTEWLKNQISRLTNHKFYTHSAKSLVKVSVDQQIATTKKFLADE